MGLWNSGSSMRQDSGLLVCSLLVYNNHSRFSGFSMFESVCAGMFLSKVGGQNSSLNSIVSYCYITTSTTTYLGIYYSRCTKPPYSAVGTTCSYM